MNRYLTSVAALALLAAPAFAQDHEHGGGPGGGGHPGGGAPHAGGPAMHGAPGGGPRGGGAPGGFARPAAPAAPAAQAGRPDRGGNAGGNNGRLDATAVNRALVGDRAPQDNRGPGGNNRPGSGPGGNNRPGFDNHGPGGNFGPGNHGGARPGNGSRPNFSNFRDFHRNFNAARRFHAPSYRRPSGWYYRRWTFGEILPALFWSQQYWLNDYYSYDLPPPPPGATWVRYGDDALLIDRYSGEIITVEYGIFY